MEGFFPLGPAATHVVNLAQVDKDNQNPYNKNIK